MDDQPRDPDLVQRARAGDKAALSALLTRHRPLAWRLAARLLGDSGEAEDVAQEACLQAWLGLDQLRSPERFGPWLAGIALNLARMRLRGRRGEVAWEMIEGGRLVNGFLAMEGPPSVETLAEARAEHAAVLEAIQALPAEQQLAVRWHYLDGLALSEIALLIGAPLGTVKARLHRARVRLRANLLSAGTAPQPKESPMLEVVIQEVLMRVPRLAEGAPAQPFEIPIAPEAARDVVEAAGREAPPDASPVRAPLPSPSPAQFVVVLKERAGQRVLPIWIGPHEAQLIKWQLAGGSAPRPLTYELIARLLAAAGARVERVTISRLEADIYYATIQLAPPASPPEVDARPSDALALAQRLQAPIFVDAEILTQAGAAESDLAARLEAAPRRFGEPEARPPGAVDEWLWRPAPAPNFNPPAPK